MNVTPEDRDLLLSLVAARLELARATLGEVRERLAAAAVEGAAMRQNERRYEHDVKALEDLMEHLKR